LTSTVVPGAWTLTAAALVGALLSSLLSPSEELLSVESLAPRLPPQLPSSSTLATLQALSLHDTVRERGRRERSKGSSSQPGLCFAGDHS
jgi:hypothetical protein